MKCDGALILEYRQTGVIGGTGDVYIHMGTSEERIYSGSGGYAFYETMKQFIRARHAGSGEWWEENTQHGRNWRERPTSNVHYVPMDEC
jgi:hypothetical protein